MKMHDEILKEIDAAYEKKLKEFRALAKLFREEITSKINLRKDEINKETETKPEVVP
jgi:F0F1-type ATP synthase membrane subunit b/b'